MDLRNSEGITWKDLVASILESLGGRAELNKIYNSIEGYRKTFNNPHWKEKIRQTLQIHSDLFCNISKGFWKLA